MRLGVARLNGSWLRNDKKEGPSGRSFRLLVMNDRLLAAALLDHGLTIGWRPLLDHRPFVIVSLTDRDAGADRPGMNADFVCRYRSGHGTNQRRCETASSTRAK